MHILRPGVLEALKLRPMAQIISLVDVFLIPVECIEGVRQINDSEDRSHPLRKGESLLITRPA